MAADLDRRDFLKAAAVGLAASAVPAASATAQPQEAATATHPPHRPRSPDKAQARLFLTDREAAFLTALVDVMLPADDVGPGGVEAGVVTYFDRQLGSAWGAGGRMYLGGPWAEGTPSQGYQLPLTPAQLVRAAIPEIDKVAHMGDGKDFAELPPDKRNDILNGLDSGDIALAALPGKVVVGLLHSMVIEGYFADPAYGGNRAMSAWRMIGFPGARGAYVDEIEASRGKPFQGDAVALADLQ